ncbi:hypothetical protein QYE76_025295 [Lolium multiflorum]|uniref:Zinc knuckle CX2CX4HX4C domain-containing protein n=1 Tax=Lolium multiflorum TaxID=4521 RepID=A0AAD8RDU6_LOLMU|nr:hypothetical protein QYE76_025295 [Lolium multiflorum]
MAVTRESGEGSGEPGGLGASASLEELLRSLKLSGADIGGISVAKEEVEALKEGTKWMAVMRLLSSKTFSAASMKKTMEFAWAPAQEVTFRDLEEDNRKYDGCCKASSVPLNRIQAWVQIHDIPELFRKRQIMEELAANIGEVISVEMSGGVFVRARVWLDVRRELTRFVTIKPEGADVVVMRVKYEKIPRFCAICGHLGHVKEECGTGEHTGVQEGFGKWLLADTAWNRAQLLNAGDQARPQGRENAPPGAGRGAGMHSRGGGREGTRGGRGTGRSVIWGGPIFSVSNGGDDDHGVMAAEKHDDEVIGNLYDATRSLD